MAEFARRTGVEVEVATFEAWDASREFDAVVAGQAWHWVDPVAGAAKAAEALRPDGRLAVFWNAFQLPPGVAEAFAEVYRRVVTDSPFDFQSTRQTADAYQDLCAKAADGIRKVGGFSEPEQWRFDWERRYTRDEWMDQMPAYGTLTMLAPETVAEVLEGVGTAVDVMGGSFAMRYSTVVATARRR
jgi:SAM-dependent methyltransferase